MDHATPERIAGIPRRRPDPPRSVVRGGVTFILDRPIDRYKFTYYHKFSIHPDSLQEMLANLAVGD